MASKQQELDTPCNICRQSMTGYRENAAIVEPEHAGDTSDTATPRWKDALWVWGPVNVMIVYIIITAFIPLIMAKFTLGLACIAVVAAIVYGLYKLARVITVSRLEAIWFGFVVIAGASISVSMIIYGIYLLGDLIITSCR